MLGSFAEWCATRFEFTDDWERAVVGPARGEDLRVLRGSDVDHPRASLRCAQRAGQLRTSRWDAVGLRAAATLTGD